jgi:hypothetical protein
VRVPLVASLSQNPLGAPTPHCQRSTLTPLLRLPSTPLTDSSLALRIRSRATHPPQNPAPHAKQSNKQSQQQSHHNASYITASTDQSYTTTLIDSPLRSNSKVAVIGGDGEARRTRKGQDSCNFQFNH